MKSGKAVITIDTAFYLYGFSDEVSDVCTMAAKRESAPISDKRVKQIFTPRDILDQGKTTLEYKGYDLRIIDRECMLVELAWYKDEQPKAKVKSAIEVSRNEDLSDGYDTDSFHAKIALLMNHFIDIAIWGYGWIDVA